MHTYLMRLQFLHKKYQYIDGFLHTLYIYIIWWDLFYKIQIFISMNNLPFKRHEFFILFNIL